MKKNLIIICNLACLICFFIVLLGCDQAADKPATPKIVRKKIRTQTGKTADAPKAQTVKRSQPLPKSKPAAKPADPSKQIPASEPPVVAKKSEPPAVTSGKTAKFKPPVKPKSDISIVRTPAADTAGSKTAAGQPTMPPASQTAIAKTVTEGRPIYNPKGKIDPFEPLFRDKPSVAIVKKKRKKRIPRTPLEKIDLSQLKLVGIILASSGNRALVEESNGKGYVIKSGTYVGTNAGKVVRIEKDKVIVAEEYEDVLGNVTLRNKELKLPKPAGEL
ncbi:MAG: pilus assembly protein PilP [Desulfobacterales bacterium]|nr:pilus assembly protein PilP [Desulfobacterales bacterium]